MIQPNNGANFVMWIMKVSILLWNMLHHLACRARTATPSFLQAGLQQGSEMFSVQCDYSLLCNGFHMEFVRLK